MTTIRINHNEILPIVSELFVACQLKPLLLLLFCWNRRIVITNWFDTYKQGLVLRCMYIETDWFMQNNSYQVQPKINLYIQFQFSRSYCFVDIMLSIINRSIAKNNFLLILRPKIRPDEKENQYVKFPYIEQVKTEVD